VIHEQQTCTPRLTFAFTESEGDSALAIMTKSSTSICVLCVKWHEQVTLVITKC
jgi:hypothetical protein